jgi:CNT family concentrative nucleoside transporter
MFYNFISFAGIFVLIGLGWLFSRRRANMNWRAIGFGVALQLAIGLMVFRIKAGTQIFLWINDGAVKVLAAATLACLMTACVAGTFYTEGSVLFGK